MISIAMVLFALAAVGGSSASEGWVNPHGRFGPVVPRLWVDGDAVLHYTDTLNARQFVLDELALRYVGDYTTDPRTVRVLPPGSGWMCGFGLDEVRARIPRSERTETALRARARSLVERHARSSRQQ